VEEIDKIVGGTTLGIIEKIFKTNKRRKALISITPFPPFNFFLLPFHFFLINNNDNDNRRNFHYHHQLSSKFNWASFSIIA